MSQGDLNRLYEDKTIPIRFTNYLENYNLTAEQEESVNSGKCIILNEDNLYKYPIAIAKIDDMYIISDIGGHSMFNRVREIITLNSSIATVLGTIMFLIVGKMIVKPIKEITDATKKVATGDFNIILENKREDELGDLIDSFNKMTRDLGSIEILRNDFISDISHEFKTPITSIEGYTKLLAASDDEVKDEYTDIILQETKRLSTMASNILTINKLDNENIINSEEFRLDEQIRKSVLLLENKWSLKNIELDLQLAEVKIQGNKGLINQIWINLLDNAIKFSPSNGLISLELKENKDKCKFIIQDQGVGINKEDQERIFEKFYKADKSRSTEGTGLGLSIVKRIVDLHNGKIELYSKIGEGTRISVILNKKVIS
jgi:signal transduction histidine kinase